jgi:hypothetical protein
VGTVSHGTKGGDTDPKAAGDPVVVVPEEGGVQQRAQHTPKPSARCRKAIAERHAERMRKGKDLERAAAAEERRVAADTRRALEALVQRGAEGRVQTKEWRRMQVISKNRLSSYGPLSATNSEGISRIRSWEVPPHLDVNTLNVTDTFGSRKPCRNHKPESQSETWPKQAHAKLPKQDYTKLGASHTRHSGGASRNPLRGVQSAWKPKPKPHIDSHIDGCLPHLRDGVPNLGEPMQDWAEIWHPDDAAGDARNDPGTEQPESAGSMDRTLFTRKTNPRDARCEVSERATHRSSPHGPCEPSARVT